MSGRRHVTSFTVEFGDCDPAKIVFYPNFFRWMDSAARHFFAAVGVTRWHEIEDAPGLVGVPLVDAGAKFLRPATYGDVIEVETSVAEWRERSFSMSHVIRCGGHTLVEGREVRVFACADPDDPKRLRAVAPPASIRRLIDAGA
jgi:4-hydroxybenzoyl-CoA thioesterase